MLFRVLFVVWLCSLPMQTSSEGVQLETITSQIKNETARSCNASDLERADIGFNISAHFKIIDITPQNCSLKRFENSVPVAVSILQEKHLVLIGDSVTRYMYLSLVYFLETGNFTSPHPSQTWEKDYDSWTDFYKVLIVIEYCKASLVLTCCTCTTAGH
jgi:hypothetical protein